MKLLGPGFGGSALAIAANWEVKQWMENLSVSLSLLLPLLLCLSNKKTNELINVFLKIQLYTSTVMLKCILI